MRNFLKYWFTAVLSVLAVLAALSQPNNDSLNIRKWRHYPTSQWGVSTSGVNNGLWGYVDTVLNKEYAVAGNFKGLLITDVTTPAQPVNKLWVPGVYSIWREIRSYKNFIYMVHDHVDATSPVSAEGLLIVDMDSLSSSRYKKMKIPVPMPNNTWDTVRRAHTLFVDENGYLYLFGTNVGQGGAVILNLQPDPWNPTVVGHFNGNYIHDGYVRNDTLWAASLWNGLVVVNVALKSSPMIIGSFATPSNFAHNAWLDDAGDVLFTTDEVANGFITAYDITNLSNVTELWRKKVQPNTGIIPHNAHVNGRHLHTSYYTFGTIVQDIECSKDPVLIGYYDTSPYSGGNFHGAWSVYPYLPSGTLLVNDLETGLWILNPDLPRVTRIGGTVVFDVNGAGQNTPWTAVMGNNPGYLYFKQRSDTVQVSSNGTFFFRTIGPLSDTLVFSMPGVTVTAEIPFLRLGGGCPQDTLVINHTVGLGESPTSALVLRTSESAWHVNGWPMDAGTLEYTLYTAVGQKIQHGLTHTSVVPFPEGGISGAYILHLRGINGRIAVLKAIRP